MIDKTLIQFVDDKERGVQFLDISPILADVNAMTLIHNALVSYCMQGPFYKDPTPGAIIAIESRGFIFAASVAKSLHLPLIMCRKAGKLPGKTMQVKIQNEYDTYIMELPIDMIERFQNYVLIDDVVATGGTFSAISQALQNKNKQVQCLAAIELIMPHICEFQAAIEVKLPNSKIQGE